MDLTIQSANEGSAAGQAKRASAEDPLQRQPEDEGTPSPVLKNDQAAEPQPEQSRPAMQPLETDETQSEDTPNYPTGFKFSMIVISLCMVTVIVGLDNTIVSTAVPSITNEFKTIADIAWYSSA